MSISALRDPQVRASLNVAPKASGVALGTWETAGTNVWVAQIFTPCFFGDVLIANLFSSTGQSVNYRLYSCSPDGNTLFFFIQGITAGQPTPTNVSISWILMSPTT